MPKVVVHTPSPAEDAVPTVRLDSFGVYGLVVLMLNSSPKPTIEPTSGTRHGEESKPLRRFLASPQEIYAETLLTILNTHVFRECSPRVLNPAENNNTEANIGVGAMNNSIVLPSQSAGASRLCSTR